ncbi:UPF0280 family protein [Candidatus Micrarchaeota archaeon]|nr:UPF0280 family protein [Candidatus Micrarchaeota archaeon]
MIGRKLVFRESKIFLKIESEGFFDIAHSSLLKNRAELEEYIGLHPFFKSTLEPLEVERDAPWVVKLMAEAAEKTGVGPMAAVAGALADLMLEDVVGEGCRYAIIENGGDIAMQVDRVAKVVVYAGSSPFSGKIGFDVMPEDTPMGVCTSSGTVGHAISFGNADAAVAFADSAALADAAATALGNAVKGEEDVKSAAELAKKLSIRGAVVIKGESIAAWGRIPKIVKSRGLPEYFYKEFFE